MSSTAVCFKCGAKKKEATTLCSKCMAAPRSFEDLVLSYCLSLECVKPETLKRCRQHFKVKDRPPKFRSQIVDLAAQLAEKHADVGDTSIEFSSAMFEFTDLDEDDRGLERTISVQIIGRPKGLSDDEPPAEIGSVQKTCHFETWTIGNQISQEQVDRYRDGDQVFVWYRWIAGRWAWQCVSRGKFAQLKSVEDGNPF